MDNIKIQTTQNVDIEYELASIGDRILAGLLDYLIFAAYLFLVFLGYGFSGIRLHSLGSLIALLTIVSLPMLFYDLVCEMVFQGRSFGKMIMKIKVVKLDGTQATLGSYILRWLLRIIDTVAFSAGVALIAVLSNDRGQRIGDMAAGTTVVKMKQKVKLSDTILNKVRPEYTLVYPEVSRLSDSDIAIIKEVMRVALRTGNQAAIIKLSAKIKETMGINPNLPHVQFLSTVVQDYSHYNFDK